ncbi:hypothetical protein DMUE_3260 [Dictyocoela muelleri]|nr:hypothetical protein DMUE_3260 [Dictyocoela muelleri]
MNTLNIATYILSIISTNITNQNVTQNVLIWGTSTNGIGDIDSILTINEYINFTNTNSNKLKNRDLRNFIEKRKINFMNLATVLILVTSEEQYYVVKNYLEINKKEYVEINDIEEYAKDKINLIKHYIPNWGWVGPSKVIMIKKQSAEEKISKISKFFEKSICFFNNASVFFEGEQIYVTPENKVENSFTISEYRKETETLWLEPSLIPETNISAIIEDYYFAYFYDDYCKTLVEFLINLSIFLKDDKKNTLNNKIKRVKIVTM